jgi:flagellar hook-associated protein FlgK
MSILSSTPLSGMNAAQSALGVFAHNVANAQTPGFRRQTPVQDAAPGGGVRVSPAVSAGPLAGAEGPGLQAEDMVGQLQAKNAFLANLRVFQTGDQMLGALLDTRA